MGMYIYLVFSEFLLWLQVLFMSKSEFEEFKQNDDGWSEDEEEEAAYPLQFGMCLISHL